MATFMATILENLCKKSLVKENSAIIAQEKQKKKQKTDIDDQVHLEQNEIYKFFIVITLRNTLVKLVQSINSVEENDKTNQSLSIIVSSVLKALTYHFTSSVTPNCRQNEMLTDFLATLATNTNNFLQMQYKNDISLLFYNEKFFSMSERSLIKWQTIMRQFISNANQTNDVFDELFTKFKNVENSFFISRVNEHKQKSLFYKRLAFLVYSSEINSLEEHHMDTLLKKMAEGFKNLSKDTEMKVMLFLLSRILMLRLSTVNLAEALRKLWPHLLNELVNAFDTNNTHKKHSAEDFMLYAEGIKLIELMSQLNIEDFQMN